MRFDLPFPSCSVGYDKRGNIRMDTISIRTTGTDARRKWIHIIKISLHSFGLKHQQHFSLVPNDFDFSIFSSGFSGSKSHLQISAKESIGVVMWCAMSPTTMWIIGSGRRSLIAAQPIGFTLRSNSQFGIVRYFRAMRYRARRHSVYSSTNSMQLRVNRRHGNPKAINWLVIASQLE